MSWDRNGLNGKKQFCKKNSSSNINSVTEGQTQEEKKVSRLKDFNFCWKELIKFALHNIAFFEAMFSLSRGMHILSNKKDIDPWKIVKNLLNIIKVRSWNKW